jgi:hypothetical protein
MRLKHTAAQRLCIDHGMAVTTTTKTTYLYRLIGAAALDPGVYEEVEADESATTQAFVTVVLSSVAAGVGARGFGGDRMTTFVFVTVVSLMAWAAWALVTLEVGIHLLPARDTRSNVGELLRTLGFATAPGFLRLFGALDGGTMSAFVISSVWMLAAMVIAVRQSLDYESTGRAIAVCAIGWVLALVIGVGLGLVFGPTLS